MAQRGPKPGDIAKAKTDPPSPEPEQPATTDPPPPPVDIPRPSDQPPPPVAPVEVRGWPVPREFEERTGAPLLMRACERFGVNPDREVHPQELENWRFIPADPIEQRPASVRFVTSGGVRIRFYEDDTIDADTEERLRVEFHAFRIDEKKQRINFPLPPDLPLPRPLVTGNSDSTAHKGHLLGKERTKI